MAATLSQRQEIVLECIDEIVDQRKVIGSRDIARHCELTPTQVGTNMKALQREVDQFDIQRWRGSTGAATWEIKRVA